MPKFIPLKYELKSLKLRVSRVAQRKRAGPITQRSMDRNHPLLAVGFFEKLDFRKKEIKKLNKDYKRLSDGACGTVRAV